MKVFHFELINFLKKIKVMKKIMCFAKLVLKFQTLYQFLN